MALITLNYSTEAELRSAWASIPSDVVASGNSYLLQQSKVEIVLSVPLNLTWKATSSENNITLAAAPGASYTENTSIATTAFVYNAANGAALRIGGDNNDALLTVDIPNFTIRGMQIFQAAGDTQNAIRATVNAIALTIDRCIIDNAGQLTNCWAIESRADLLKVTSSLVVHRSSLHYAVRLDRQTAIFENVTFIRPSNFTSGGQGVYVVTDGNVFRNCVALGFTEFANVPNVVGNSGTNNACSGDVSFGANNKPNLTPSNEVVSFLNDFRLKTGSNLIDAGATPSEYNTLAPNGVRQQGTSADIGAWEFPNALVAPSATVTAVSVTGQNVTISGTTTGVPTSGTASVAPSSIAYNSAEAAGPATITFGSGTFTVTFTGLKVGEYNVQYQIANSGYTVSGQNPLGAFRIAGASATLTQDSMSGQVLRISGTVTGSPTSGQLIVPAAATNPNGAFDQTKGFTITGSTCEVSITLPPGNYDAGIARFTNAAGTSLPQSGTSAVSVIGIDGNPQAPDDTPAPADTTAPTMTGAITVSAQTTSGFTLTWPAATDAVGVAYYEVDNGSGAYVNVGNVLTLAVTGKSSATTYQTRVRALDAAGNASSPLTANATTAAVTPAPDTTPPVFTGTVNVANATATTATISWSAASDNVAVTGYEYSIDGGTVYVNAGTARTASLAGLNPSTIYSLRVRAYDAAGNRSSAITGSFETESASTPPTGFTPSISRTVRILAGRSVFDAGTFWTVSGNNSPVGSKDPNSTIDIHFDWTSWLEDIGGAELSAVDFILSPELVSVAGVPSETGGTVFVSGGSTGQNMSITCRITTATTPPRIEDRTVVLQIKEQ